jgi:SsrA-binding protein
VGGKGVAGSRPRIKYGACLHRDGHFFTYLHAGLLRLVPIRYAHTGYRLLTALLATISRYGKIKIDMVIKNIATNRKAYHNFYIGETYEAGIALLGSEIKSVRGGHVSLGDAYVRPEKNGLWLYNAHIARYEASSYMGHDPLRPRKLLMHRKEILNLTGKVAEKGLTLVATKMYIKGSIAKVEIALAKGKKLYDKREAISRREVDRELERTLKSR